MKLTCWKELIGREMEDRGESWADVVSSTLTDEGLMAEFDGGYGSAQGEPFTLWTRSRVYFPTEYDGAEHVHSVARFPDGNPTPHI